MSRIGKEPVKIPSGVNVEITTDAVKVSGAKGNLEQALLSGVTVNKTDDTVVVARDNDEKIPKANHGLMRSLINNMVVGVSAGFKKDLQVNGVGYKVALAGTDLKLNLGYSHEIIYKIPAGINVEVKSNNISVNGIDKQQVGAVAAEIRSFRKPEPYKGKGIKYADEFIVRKSGKSGKDK